MLGQNIEPNYNQGIIPTPPISETLDVDIVIPTPVIPEEVSSQGETKLVTFDAEDGNVDDPSVNNNGRYVVFESLANNLVPNDNNYNRDIFIRDLVDLTTKRVSLTADNNESNRGSYNPQISGDGRYVVFESDANNFVTGDTNGYYGTDIFVRDLVENTTKRVSVAGDGFDTQGNGSSYNASISANGRYVFFESNANNLISGDTNGDRDVFVRDLFNNTTERVSVTNDPEDSQGNNASVTPSISADGRYIAFDSSASNFASEDEGYTMSDIFLRDRGFAYSDSIVVDEVVDTVDDVVNIIDVVNDLNPGNGNNAIDESQFLLSDVHRFYQ